MIHIINVHIFAFHYNPFFNGNEYSLPNLEFEFYLEANNDNCHLFSLQSKEQVTIKRFKTFNCETEANKMCLKDISCKKY